MHSGQNMIVLPMLKQVYVHSIFVIEWLFKPYDCIGKKRLLWVETEYTDVTSFVMKQGKHATEGQC